MSSVPNRLNLKLARLFYKYMDEPREKPEEMEVEKPFVKPEDYEAYAPFNFSWFIDKKIAAMGYPRNEANLNYLVDAGVDHLITLSPEKRPPIEEFNRKLKWTEIRVKEFGAPTLKQILKFIEICERAEIRAETVGVHCHHGRGRTGTMLACYLVHFKDLAPERAVLTVRIQRPGSCETYDQEKIVCHYHDCVRGTVPKPDYRLLEDKVYFDISMKYTYGEVKEEETVTEPENEGLRGKEEIEKERVKDKEEIEKERLKKIKLRRQRPHAMVINHKIYF